MTDSRRKYTSDILADACKRAGISVEDALGRRGCRERCIRRFQVMATLRTERNWSLLKIGAVMRRNHTTVLSGLRRHAQLTRGVDGQA